jgi:hypothetical protein
MQRAAGVLAGAYIKPQLLFDKQPSVESAVFASQFLKNKDIVEVSPPPEQQRGLLLLRSLFVTHARLQKPVVAALVSQAIQLCEPFLSFRVDQMKRNGEVELHLEANAARPRENPA